MAHVRSRTGQGRAVHVLARHDRRGHGEDRRNVPDREAGRSRPRCGRARLTRTASGAPAQVKAESLKGSLLNDVHLAVSLRRAKDTKWVVRTNPYEGGSDHTAFADAGIPSLLNWHFTDRYYHTNLDRPDKTSALEMVNVGVAVATSAWFLASADERDAMAVADLLAASASARLALEQKQGAAIVASGAGPLEGRGD